MVEMQICGLNGFLFGRWKATKKDLGGAIITILQLLDIFEVSELGFELHQLICKVNWPGCDFVILCPLGAKISLEVQGPILGCQKSGRVALARKIRRKGAKSTWSRSTAFLSF